MTDQEYARMWLTKNIGHDPAKLSPKLAARYIVAVFKYKRADRLRRMVMAGNLQQKATAPA